MKILVLSPHLDDAVFSCGDHILKWQKAGHQVVIITIFTKFNPTIKTPHTLKYLSWLRSSDSETYEKMRKTEDRQAMQALGVEWHYWNFVDAGFRVNKDKKALYPSTKMIFDGRTATEDHDLEKILLEKIKKSTPTFDQVIIPFGLGHHVDHLLTRKVTAHIIPKHKKRYYLDVPYMLHFKNWSLLTIYRLFRSKYSMLWLSPAKRQLLSYYPSQLSRRLRFSLGFPEILI